VVSRVSSIVSACTNPGNSAALRISTNERRLNALRMEYTRLSREHRAAMDKVATDLGATKLALHKVIRENQQLRGEKGLPPRFEACDYDALSNLARISTRAELARLSAEIDIVRTEKSELEMQIDALRYLCSDGLGGVAADDDGRPGSNLQPHHHPRRQGRAEDRGTSPIDIPCASVPAGDPTVSVSQFLSSTKTAARWDNDDYDIDWDNTSTSSWSPVRDFLLGETSGGGSSSFLPIEREPLESASPPGQQQQQPLAQQMPPPPTAPTSWSGMMTMMATPQATRAAPGTPPSTSSSSYAQTLNKAQSPYVARLLRPASPTTTGSPFIRPVAAAHPPPAAAAPPAAEAAVVVVTSTPRLPPATGRYPRLAPFSVERVLMHHREEEEAEQRRKRKELAEKRSRFIDEEGLLALATLACRKRSRPSYPCVGPKRKRRNQARLAQRGGGGNGSRFWDEAEGGGEEAQAEPAAPARACP
jgi:hypothetical protein